MMNRHAEALRCAQEALRINLAALSESHHRVAETRLVIARALHGLGQDAEAIRSAQAALKIWRELHGAHDARIADGLTFLATVLAKSDPDASDRHGFEAIEVARRRFGPEHSQLAEALTAFGMVLYGRQDFERALPLLRKSLAIREKVYGAKHFLSVGTRINVAGAFFGLRKIDDADASYRRVLPLVRAGHRQWLPTVLDGLAAVAQMRQDFARALELEREARAAHRALGYTNTELYTTIVSQMTRCAFMLERYEEAAEAGREALTRVRHHSLLAIVGVSLMHLERAAEAEPLLRESLSLRVKQMPDNWLRFNIMSVLGDALARQKKFDEAEPLLLEGYERMRPPEQWAIRKQQALDRIVRLYEAWGKPGKAKEWRAKGAKK